MSRERRTISQTGFLTCTRCGGTKHISEFYQNKGVWFIQEDPLTGECTVYGKPNSWCKNCQKEHQKERKQNLKESETQPDLEWEQAQEAAAAMGYVLVKDPKMPTGIRGIPLTDWEPPSSD